MCQIRPQGVRKVKLVKAVSSNLHCGFHGLFSTLRRVLLAVAEHTERPPSNAGRRMLLIYVGIFGGR
jgi:hypothetical protein